MKMVKDLLPQVYRPSCRSQSLKWWKRNSSVAMAAVLLLSKPTASLADDTIPSYDLRLSGAGQETYLKLDEAIATVLRSSLEIKIEAITPQLEEDRTLQAVGEFDPAFESRFRYDNLDNPQTSQEFLGTGGDRFANGNLVTRNRVFSEENVESKVGIVGRLRTGTEYDFGVRANSFRNDLTGDPTVGVFDPEYRSFTGLTFLQPLLRDYGKEVNEAKITVSHRDTEIAHQVFRQKLSSIVKDVVSAYYESFLAYEDAMVKRFEVEVLRRMALEKRDQLERGTATELEASAVKSRLSESYERFLLSRQTLLTKNGDLLMLMQQEFDLDAYPVYLPIDPPVGATPEFSSYGLVREAMDKSPSYLIAVENVEKLGVMLKYRENQLLPRVDLEGTMGISGLSGSYGAAFDNTFDGQGHDYGFGISVSMPLGNTEKKALYAETEKQRRQALIRVKKEELEMGIMVNRHISAIQTHKKRLHAARLSIRIAKESLNQARENLEKGIIKESALMKVERDLSETRLRQYAAAADLQKSLADLYDTTGTLLDEYGIKANHAAAIASVETPEEEFEDEQLVLSNLITDSPANDESEKPVFGKTAKRMPKTIRALFQRPAKRSVEEDESREIEAVHVIVARPLEDESSGVREDSVEQDKSRDSEADRVIVARPVGEESSGAGESAPEEGASPAIASGKKTGLFGLFGKSE
jgi:outer membrane protein TolC